MPAGGGCDIDGSSPESRAASAILRALPRDAPQDGDGVARRRPHSTDDNVPGKVKGPDGHWAF